MGSLHFLPCCRSLDSSSLCCCWSGKETNRRKPLSTAGIPRSAVRYRRQAESVQEFVVLTPRASEGSSRKHRQAMGGPRPRSKSKPGHPWVLVGVGMLVTVLLLVVSQAVVPWGMKTADDLHYGYPRTTQEDHYVGHEQRSGPPSHFVAMNLHGQITVVELPGGICGPRSCWWDRGWWGKARIWPQ
jgi:hypothetical protein